MRIGLLKPDYGANGGFERLLAGLCDSLEARGIPVETVSFDAVARSARCFGIPVPSGVRDQHHEYFQYLSMIERMDELDLDPFDVIVASQPPTYLVRHPNVVAIFYHQARVFYDLADLAVASGVVESEVHQVAVDNIRRLDRQRVGNVATWLAGSGEVADRLRRYWSIPEERICRLEATPAGPAPTPAPYDPSGPAVCVSRHEWPKRTELVVQAAHRDPDVTYELIGGGSRLGWVRDLNVRMARDHSLATTDDDAMTWRNHNPRLLRPGPTAAGAPNLIIHGEMDDIDRDDAYARAGVVIAPAFCEDYGLTVLEAFRHGRPIMVCRDGGGLVELVEETGAGLIVSPDADSIAEGVRRLRQDLPLARSMAEAAVAISGHRTHRTAVETLRDAILSASCAS